MMEQLCRYIGGPALRAKIVLRRRSSPSMRMDGRRRPPRFAQPKDFA